MLCRIPVWCESTSNDVGFWVGVVCGTFETICCSDRGGVLKFGFCSLGR